MDNGMFEVFELVRLCRHQIPGEREIFFFRRLDSRLLAEPPSYGLLCFDRSPFSPLGQLGRAWGSRSAVPVKYLQHLWRHEKTASDLLNPVW